MAESVRLYSGVPATHLVFQAVFVGINLVNFDAIYCVYNDWLTTA